MEPAVGGLAAVLMALIGLVTLLIKRVDKVTDRFMSHVEAQGKLHLGYQSQLKTEGQARAEQMDAVTKAIKSLSVSNRRICRMERRKE